MERPPSATRRRTLDLPAKPEAGLAEWTTKIKALQRQVDEDEEAEHRRLEQEIVASRLARMRRSTGYSQARTLDLANSEYAHALKDDDPQTNTDTAISTSDKREDALQKLMGDTRDAKERLAATSPSRPSPTSRSNPSVAPISLAAFMGGRATGPRLTRHAPQQDAHDPTQFEQRTHVTTPHPIFGRGGVAMPGMTGKAPMTSAPTDTRDERDKLVPVSNQLAERDRKVGTPSIAKTYEEKVPEQPSVPQKTWQTPRQRTISTPSGVSPSRSSPTGQYLDALSKPKADPSRLTSYSPGPRATTPQAQAQRNPSPPSTSTSPIPRSSPYFQATSPSSNSPASRSVPSFQLSYPTTPSSSPKSAVTPASLARPIQPTPRQSLNGPQVVSSHPSTAFLRTPPSKEPTPSISRLQGRGFVQSMVKASSELEMGVMSSPSLPDKADSPGKQAPVLDRWKFSGNSPAVSPPSIISPKPVPLQKARTVDPGPAPASPTTPIKPEHTGRPKSRASLPALSDVRSSPGTSDAGRNVAPRQPGLGSSSTMISYIKPLKTGDGPPTASPPEVDELGVRVQARGGEAGKPLSHLTKDRAKKPRKSRGAQEVGQQVQLQASSFPTTDNVAVQHAGQPKLNTPSPFATVAKPRIAELLVSATPVSSHLAKPPLSPRIASPLQDRFEDDFVPPAKPVVPTRLPSSADGLDIAPSAVPKSAPNLGIRTGFPAPTQNRDKSPVTPSRHARIPSTGNRATVMDVAQAFHERVAVEPPNLAASMGAVSPEVVLKELSPAEPENEEDAAPLPDVKSLVANWGPRNGATHPPQADKRKSSFEKYSAIALPPLREEKTPVSSPAGTLARSTATPVQEQVVPEAEGQVNGKENGAMGALPAPGAKESTQEKESKLIRIECTDDPLPKIDITTLMYAQKSGPLQDIDTQTISIDVMSIIGNTATTVKGDIHVFYDNEVLAIIRRAKSKSSGLVTTKVWGWRGKRCTIGEREERKLQDLARRYNTALISVNQYCEPSDFVQMLGGQLVTRQGTRAHWSSENTAMHLVRSIGNVIFIDELELHIRNLCSGFSYCLSLLDTLYVWHGCGSMEKERSAAIQYAQVLATQPSSVVVLSEGVTDNDEMFWMILGDGGYAKADYWKWRTPAADMVPRIWRVDASRSGEEVFAVPSLSNQPAIHDFVYIADCVWELFVLVCSEARGKRQDIKLALSIASELSRRIASSRPFPPTVHVLVLPSQVPTDLRLNFRDLDEVQLNCGIIPDHMNLLPISEAEEHLRTMVWEKVAVQDPTMLPLGVHTSNMK